MWKGLGFCSFLSILPKLKATKTLNQWLWPAVRFYFNWPGDLAQVPREDIDSLRIPIFLQIWFRLKVTKLGKQRVVSVPFLYQTWCINDVTQVPLTDVNFLEIPLSHFCRIKTSQIWGFGLSCPYISTNLIENCRTIPYYIFHNTFVNTFFFCHCSSSHGYGFV